MRNPPLPTKYPDPPAQLQPVAEMVNPLCFPLDLELPVLEIFCGAEGNFSHGSSTNKRNKPWFHVEFLRLDSQYLM